MLNNFVRLVKSEAGDRKIALALLQVACNRAADRCNEVLVELSLEDWIRRNLAYPYVSIDAEGRVCSVSNRKKKFVPVTYEMRIEFR